MIVLEETELGARYTTSFTMGEGMGLVDGDATSLKTLEKCTELTRLNLDVRGLGDMRLSFDIGLDLHNLTKVKSYSEYYCSLKKLTLPPNIVSYFSVGQSGNVDGSYCQKLERIYISSGNLDFKNLGTYGSLTSIEVERFFNIFKCFKCYAGIIWCNKSK